MAFWTCGCGAVNGARSVKCEICDEPKPKGAKVELDAKKPAVCETDGSVLENGFCHAGGGYAKHWPCPFVCSICRGPLTWNGGCHRCHGCRTGERDDWTYPGDRYELDAGHWRLVAKGPFPVASQEQNKAALRVVHDVWAKNITAEQGHERVRDIFGEEGRPA
jgi:hypothetical protein